MCRDTRGQPLNKYGSAQSEESICGGCKFFPTKPESVPDEIVEFVGIALELSELEEGNATFAYPDALSPLEWHCLRGLTRGRRNAESLKNERERREQKLKKRKEELNGNG